MDLSKRLLRNDLKRGLSLAGMFLAVLFAAGCESRPKAPALRDTPVFHSKAEGFRFLVPEKWKQTANGVLPGGKLDRAIMFARFRMIETQKSGFLELLCFDEGKHPSLLEYHAGPSQGVSAWKSVGEPESIEINQTPAERFIFSALIGKEPMHKEVVVFTRNQRVYSFVGLFSESDNAAREELRRAMNSIVWER